MFSARYGMNIFYIIQVNTRLKFRCAMDQAMSSASHRTSPCSVPGQSTWHFWCTNWHWDCFFSSTLFLPGQCHSIIAAYSSSAACWSYRKEKWSNLGSLSESNDLSEIRQQWVEKYFHFFSSSEAQSVQSVLRNNNGLIFHEVIFLLCSLKCHYCFHKSLTLVPLLSHTCSVHILRHCLSSLATRNWESEVLSLKNGYISIWNYHIKN
jgi:hypothetical protein